MIEITSVSNALVKEVVKLHQKKYRDLFFLIEGKKALDGAIEAGLNIKQILSENKDLLEEYEKKLKGEQGSEIYLVNDKIIKKISTTESPATVLAVAEKPVYNFEDFLNYRRLVLLDSIKDAGNLGTIIRTAAAFDIDGILLINNCADLYSTKTIRSAAGNFFKLPGLNCTLKQFQELKKRFKIVSTVVNSKNSIRNFNEEEPFIVMFGSEANGLCEELLTLSDVSYTIPMKKGVESLNLAISTGICLYEIFKR